MDTLLNVEGMTCPRCIHNINTALHELEGVEQVEVKVKEGKVAVKHVAGVKVMALITALREAGYEARSLGEAGPGEAR